MQSKYHHILIRMISISETWAAIKVCGYNDIHRSFFFQFFVLVFPHTRRSAHILGCQQIHFFGLDSPMSSWIMAHTINDCTRLVSLQLELPERCRPTFPDDQSDMPSMATLRYRVVYGRMYTSTHTMFTIIITSLHVMKLRFKCVT